jgi:hypothetical protein
VKEGYRSVRTRPPVDPRGGHIGNTRAVKPRQSAGGVGGASARGSNLRHVQQVQFLDGLAEIIAEAILVDQGG